MGNRIASVLRSALTILAVLGFCGLLTLPLASDDRAVTRRTKLSPAGKVGAPPPLAGRLTKQAVTGTVGPGDSISGTLASRGDVAYYTLTLTEERLITIRAESEAFDTLLELHNTSDPATANPLTLIGSDDDGGEANSSLTKPLSAGTYLIAVSALFGSGPFTLQVSETTVLIAAIGEVVGSIVPGQTATGILSSGGVDFYVLTVATDATLVIDLTSDDFDTFLGLYDTDNPAEVGPANLLASNDDHRLSLDSQITFTLAPGTYLIGASAFLSGGAYELMVSEGAAGGEPAEVIVPGQTVTGVLSSKGVDFYTLTVTTDATLITDLTSDDFDTFLGLFDTGNPDEAGPTNLLASNADHGLGLNSQISLNLTAGTYLISVLSAAGSGGVYTLQVEAIPTVVNPISLGVTVTGSLSASGAVDYYVFTLDQSTNVSIDLASENFDPTLELHATDDPQQASSFTFVAFDNDGGEGLNSRILRVLEAGTYLINVSSFSNAGDYSLRIFETTVGGAGPAPLTPDFDGDGTVGFSDFLQFALVFGAREGDGRFEARFDLDGSGDIGFTDFLVFAGAFGSNGVVGPDNGPALNLTGTWTFSGNFSNAELSTSCSGTGTATITHSGSSITGNVVQEGSCNYPGGFVDNSGTFQLVGGQLNGNNVSFQMTNCSYTGTVSGSNQMTGSVTCQQAILGQNYTFTGEWQVGR